MIRLAAIFFLFLLCGCGYSSRNNEAIGQVKKVVQVTPILCPNYTIVDISLGVLRNGVGSMSTEDVWLLIPDGETVKLLQTAAENGSLVKIVYDEVRFTICMPDHQLSKVELVK